MSKKNEYRCDSCSKIFGHSTRAMRYCDLCGVELEEGYNSIIGLASGRDICFGCYSVITAAVRLGFDAEVKEYVDAKEEEKYIRPSEIKWMPEGWIPDRRGLYWWKEDADTAATIVNVWDSNDPYNGDALDMLGFIDGDEACLYAVGGRFSSLLTPPPDVEGG